MLYPRRNCALQPRSHHTGCSSISAFTWLALANTPSPPEDRAHTSLSFFLAVSTEDRAAQTRRGGGFVGITQTQRGTRTKSQQWAKVTEDHTKLTTHCISTRGDAGSPNTSGRALLQPAGAWVAPTHWRRMAGGCSACLSSPADTSHCSWPFSLHSALQLALKLAVSHGDQLLTARCDSK